MTAEFDPYYTWLGIPPLEQPPDHYRLLGLQQFEDNDDAISNACDARMAFIRTFQTGKHTAESQELLNEVSEARICLLKPEKKRAYDEQLQKKVNATSLKTAAPLPAPEPAQPQVPQIKTALPQVQPVSQIPSFGDSQPRQRSKPAAKQTSVLERLRSDWRWQVGAAGSAVALILLVVIVISNLGSSEDPTPVVQQDPKKDGSKDSVPPVPPSTDDMAPTSDDSPSVPNDGSPKPIEPAPKTDDSSTKVITQNPPPDPVDPRKDSNRDDPPVEVEPPRPIETPVPSVPKLAAVPSDADLDEAVAELGNIFSKEFAGATTPEKQSTLATVLMERASDLKSDSIDYYAMLDQARQYATKGGDWRLALTAVDQLRKSFDVHALELKSQVLATIAGGRLTSGERTEMAEALMELIDEAVRSEEIKIAGNLSDQLGKIITSLRDVEVRKQAADKRKEINGLRKRWSVITKAIDILKSDPDDAVANLVYGKYQCLTRGDWQKGLPLLAKSDDAPLKKAAEQDLENPDKSADQSELANLWYDIGSRDVSCKNFQARAHYWYARALSGAAGLASVHVKKRLEATSAVAEAAPKIAELLVAARPGERIALRAVHRGTLTGHTDRVLGVVFSRDSRYLVSYSNDRTIKIWDSATKRVLKSYSGFRGLRGIEFAADGRTVYVTDNKSIVWVDVATGQTRTMPTDSLGDITSLALSPDGKTLLSAADNDQRIMFWNAVTGRKLTMLQSPAGRNAQLAFSPDGKSVVWSATQGNSIPSKIALFDLTRNQPRWVIPAHNANTRSMLFSPDGTKLFTSGSDGVVRVWNVMTGKEEMRIGPKVSYLAALTRDGGTLVTGGKDGELRLFDAHTGKHLQVIQMHQQGILTLSISPDGRMLATGSYDGAIKLCNLEQAPAVANNNPAKPVVVNPAKPPVKPPIQENDPAAIAALKKLGARVGTSSDGLHVGFHKAAITDQDLTVLLELKRVGALFLTDVPITDAALEHVGRLNGLRILTLGRTKVTGDGLRHLATQKNLESLNLRYSQVTAEAIKHIGNIRSLRHLWLPRLTIDEHSMEILARLPNLKQIWLNECQLNEGALKRLKDFRSVEELDFPVSANPESLVYVTQMANLKGGVGKGVRNQNR
ncbi:MAG: PD40 domain-containing protein [Planctomycetes bacterium]|nr:PD40 domain-containing protein [Planctomycetota bacterium]